MCLDIAPGASETQQPVLPLLCRSSTRHNQPPPYVLRTFGAEEKKKTCESVQEGRVK